MIVADLHIHSRFARACSKRIDLTNLEKYARIKGVNLLGTGDFQHPKWFEELKNNLHEKEGILWSKTNFPFVWQTEISLIYTQDGRGRRVHHVMLAPSTEIVEQVIEKLGERGRLDYDGRPIFGFSSIELVDLMMSIDKDIEIIPAHCMTSWYGLFGSKSGFDSVEECFKEKSKHIHAIETGMSADPKMLRRVSKFDKYKLVSFSDSHSFWPWRLAREATIFDCDLNYKSIIKAIRTGEDLIKTLETVPDYGRYHYDGHRNCGVFLSPDETRKQKGICPKCGEPLTIGVLYRIEELADRSEDYKPEDSYIDLIPLTELIAAVCNISQLYSVKVWNIYNKLIKEFGNEFNVLLNASLEDLKKVVDERLARVVINNREGKLKIKPGADGVYGSVVLDKEQKKGQTIIMEF